MISKIMIRNVATYDNVGVAVENLGKVNFIYGANGCGKTTISNFLNNTEGEQFSDCKIEWERIEGIKFAEISSGPFMRENG